jgi:protein-L-isoaspartate(D-aspartate) O-methyltransferase
VLSVMERVPREEFAPPTYRDLAFADMCVPLGHGQSMLMPKLEGRILQSLAIQPEDSVLEIGTGSGYFAACLAGLARRVRTLEIFPDLAESARENLARTGVGNVTVSSRRWPWVAACSWPWARGRSWRPAWSRARAGTRGNA